MLTGLVVPTTATSAGATRGGRTWAQGMLRSNVYVGWLALLATDFERVPSPANALGLGGPPATS